MKNDGIVKYVYKTSIEKHSEIKKELLKKINLIPNNPIHNKEVNISHTDWNLPEAMHREYKTLFFEVVGDHLKKIASDIGVPHIDISNFWFQQYEENGNHDWHTHPRANFSNVYFLECPKGYTTQFANFSIECKEGDILSFPAFLPHKSPPMVKGSRKTVIAFNSNLTF